MPGATGTLLESVRKYLCYVQGLQNNQRTTNEHHLGHCTHPAESADVMVQNTEHAK